MRGVLWRLRYKLSLRDVAEMLLERGYHVAVRAHEQGLYRSSCRVLLPEIERVIREDWLGVTGVRALSQRALMSTPEHLELGDIAGEVGDLVIFGWIRAYVFARFASLENQHHLVPNRHAAAHGWAVYASEQDSLNTIICADYVYRAATHSKHRKRQPRVSEAAPSSAGSAASPSPASRVTSLTIPEIPRFEPPTPWPPTP